MSEEPISGADLSAARVRAGLTQKQLAQLLRHSERAIQGWERKSVTVGKEPLVRQVLAGYMNEGGSQPLAGFSSWTLLMELGRRMEDLERRASDRDLSETEAGDIGPGSGPKVSGPNTIHTGKRPPRGRRS